jgi:23S rRNA (cytidine1920-2'-O)/16S rRNA (cytidine1409-2'-O)-methyltransferase
LVIKLRLDLLLVSRGLAESRTKAQALIMAGLVYHGEQKLDKAGAEFAEDIELSVRGREHPWVSRGGMKLAKAIEYFTLDVTGAVALDVGASTGGFTDVLLTHGAAKVFAVDVGHGQLDVKLRNDGRVVVMEETNARPGGGWVGG